MKFLTALTVFLITSTAASAHGEPNVHVHSESYAVLALLLCLVTFFGLRFALKKH